jgi:hypothetical protein
MHNVFIHELPEEIVIFAAWRIGGLDRLADALP